MSRKKKVNTFSCSHSVRVGSQLLPCGKCINCRKNRISEWSNRMLCEYTTNKNKALFVTLTYSPKYLPSDETLHKEDLQLFLKRLRRRISYYSDYYDNFKLRFFAAGEYGSEKYTFRPHFHLILFGLDYSSRIVEDIKYCWARFVNVKINDGIYKRNVGIHRKGEIKYKRVVDRESMGIVDIETVDWQRHFYYIAKYSVKTMNREKNGVPEFIVMSRRGAVGFEYLSDNKDKILNNKCVVKIANREFLVPSIFKRKFKDEIKKHRKVTYNIVVEEKEIENYDYSKYYDMLSRDLFYYVNQNDLTSRQLFNIEEFLSSSNVDIRLLSYKDLLNIHDRNVQKEKNYMFKIRKSYYDFYNKNKKYFEYNYFDKKTGEFFESKANFVDFLNLYNKYYDTDLIYFKTYEYI